MAIILVSFGSKSLANRQMFVQNTTPFTLYRVG
jgi:hypothetical protein